MNYRQKNKSAFESRKMVQAALQSIFSLNKYFYSFLPPQAANLKPLVGKESVIEAKFSKRRQDNRLIGYLTRFCFAELPCKPLIPNGFGD
ncbi:hypothetical protein ACQ4M4_22060 [Leptolyngbya sp. AN02str]|uniref:hypothetical protein n=1 Tax=Leptolyngbya sp. AN02str TaxID=3423363 RepID=UPI003D3157D3